MSKKATLAELKRFMEADPNGAPCPLTEIKALEGPDRQQLIADLQAHFDSVGEEE
jgi:hypothetical protein